MPTDDRFFLFSTGSLYALDNAQAGPTPVKFAVVQEVSGEFNIPNKDLHGGRIFPVMQGQGKGSSKWKAKLAKIQAALLGPLFFRETPVTGSVLPVEDEVATIPGTPFKVTVVNGATFMLNLGVRYALTGQPLTLVTGAPTTGQYALNAVTGEFTFAAADTGLQVIFDYLYTILTGLRIPINNRKMGVARTFRAILHGTFDDNGAQKSVVLDLFQCVTNKLGLPFKQEGWLEQELDWELQGNAANQVGNLYLSQ